MNQSGQEDNRRFNKRSSDEIDVWEPALLQKRKRTPARTRRSTFLIVCLGLLLSLMNCFHLGETLDRYFSSSRSVSYVGSVSSVVDVICFTNNINLPCAPCLYAVIKLLHVAKGHLPDWSNQSGIPQLSTWGGEAERQGPLTDCMVSGGGSHGFG